jgi:uncharacterized protein YceK
MLLFAMALTTASGAAGCATAINIQDATLQKPYGGVTMSPADFFGGGQISESVAVLYWPLWLVDKPLSLVGDTLTLPYTLWVRRAAWLPEKPHNVESQRLTSLPSGALSIPPRRE